LVVALTTSVISQSQEEPKIAPIFLTNKISATMIIPIQTARRYGLDHPAHVVIEEREDGILIRKLNLSLKQNSEAGYQPASNVDAATPVDQTKGISNDIYSKHK
jgi:bifunctional DNA-binding transcriptional regulator/antitoxin component of YhaV-PrlF toxin-antitoxin module